MQVPVNGSPVPLSQPIALPRVDAEGPGPAASSSASGKLDPWHDPRPFSRLQAQATLLGTLPDGRVQVGGVRWGFDENGPNYRKDWDPRFSDTTIDPSALRDVYFVVEPFNGVGHALLVFEFDPAHPIVNAKGETETRLAVSVEARPKEGEVWTPVQGLKKKFGLIYQVSSFSDQVQKRSHGAGHSLELRRLDLDDTKKQALLQNALQESFKDRQGEYYHTTRNSCYTGALKLLNSVLHPSQSLPLRMPLAIPLVRPSAFLPTLAGAALRGKGLLADPVDTAIQADPKLFPNAQVKPGRLTSIARSLTDSAFFHPILRVAGAVAGAAALASTGLVGAVVGGLAGQFVTGWAADHLYTRSHLDYVSPEPWLKAAAPPVPAPGTSTGSIPGSPLATPVQPPVMGTGDFPGALPLATPSHEEQAFFAPAPPHHPTTPT